MTNQVNLVNVMYLVNLVILVNFVINTFVLLSYTATIGEYVSIGIGIGYIAAILENIEYISVGQSWACLGNVHFIEYTFDRAYDKVRVTAKVGRI